MSDAIKGCGKIIGPVGDMYVYCSADGILCHDCDTPTPTGTGLSCEMRPSAPQHPEYGCTDCLKAGSAPGIAYAPGQGPPLPDIQLSVKKGPVRGDETKQLNELIHEFGELHHLNRQDDRMAANGFPNGITATMRLEREEEARIAIHAHVSAAVQEARIGWVNHATMVSQINAAVSAARQEAEADFAWLEAHMDRIRSRDGIHEFYKVPWISYRPYRTLRELISTERAVEHRSLPHVQETE